jgi:hypothetical protein
MEHKGRQVRLIDTPGFDDDEMSDADLLKIIGDFLSTLVINRATLAGMILLQPVTTNRVPAVKSAERLRMGGERGCREVAMNGAAGSKVQAVGTQGIPKRGRLGRCRPFANHVPGA